MTETALLLLPGLDGSGVMFRPLLSHLPKEIRPIVVSYPPGEMLSYEELLPRVLAAIPDDLPFVLLGESFSGPLAIMAAAKCPPGLIGVILCATFVRNPVWFRPGWLRYFARPLAFRMFPLFTRIKAHVCGYATGELTSLKRESLANVRPEVIAHRVRSTLSVNVVLELSSCKVPILYLRGDRDFVVPRHNMKEIVAMRPTVQVTHFESPHMVLQLQPAVAAETIVSFISSLRNRTAGSYPETFPQAHAVPTSPESDSPEPR